MNNLLYFIFFMIGFLSSFLIQLFIDNFKALKLKWSDTKIFLQVKNSLEHGMGKFVCRVNNTIQINTKIENIGEISLLYFLDSKDISIFKGNNCFKTSLHCDPKIKESIKNLIDQKWSSRINDVYEISGNFFDTKTFDKMLKSARLQVLQFETRNTLHEENATQHTLTIDDILDKINQVGYDNLSQLEKDFLKNHK